MSVSLPTWRSNIGYEEGEEWVVKSMTTGYPRFFIHKLIQAFANDIIAKHGKPGQKAMLFPTRTIASRCLTFIRGRAPESVLEDIAVVNLVLDSTNPLSKPLRSLRPEVSAILFSEECFPYAKQYWQHSGDGVSSRRAEFCHGLFKDGLLILDERPLSPRSPVQSGGKLCRGPRRYQRPMSIDNTATPLCAFRREAETVEEDGQETSRFLEERFGRNLDLSFVEPAKSAIRRRIAGALVADSELTTTPLPSEVGSNTRGILNLREDDIYLYPCGMNAIFNAHRALLAARGAMKSVNFGFPYVDTLKILEKFGPGCLSLPFASESELDELERRLKEGERYLALLCEFPGNPLLTCPNLARIRGLADKYDFALVVDETVGTFANVNVLQFADVVVSSLTKIFSGDCNVMGGSAILNPNSRYYAAIKKAMSTGTEFEDTYWAEDVIFMERNSRDFAVRIERINSNAEAICEILRSNPLIKDVYYPKYNESRPNYEVVKLPGGGYGGLISATFKDRERAVAFYDALDTAKGPSLGTNFTLTSPYVLLAHYQELDWAKSCGVDPDLIRISVGLEEEEDLKAVFGRALEAAAAIQ